MGKFLFVLVISWHLFLMLQESFQVEIELERVVATPEPNIFYYDNLRVKKYNRSTYVLDGETTLKEQLDDSLDFLVIAYNFQGGQYKKIGEKKFKQICKTVYEEQYREQFDDVKKFSNIFPHGTCPIPAGKFWISNYIFSKASALPEYIPFGLKWKGESRILRGQTIIGGYDIYLTIAASQKNFGRNV